MKAKKPRKNQADATLRNTRSANKRIKALEEQVRLLWLSISGMEIDIAGLYGKQTKRGRGK